MLAKLKILALVSVMLIGAIVISGCGTGEEVAPTDTEKTLKIVTSISVLADITEEIVGDKGEVDYIVPLGEEPEEYEPSPSDFQAVSDADVFFINGFNLEAWLEQLTENIADDVDIVPTAEKGPTIPLAGTDIPDPHLWLDPMLVKDYYVEKISATLGELDPENKNFYIENAEDYKEALVNLDEQIKDKIEKVPEDHRFLITSENAFKYYGDAYGFQTDGIWEINSHEEGTPQQISRIIEIVNDHDLPAVFVEATINPQYIESIAEETHAVVYGDVHTDAVGEEGSGAESYIDMMLVNTEVFVEGLGEK